MNPDTLRADPPAVVPLRQRRIAALLASFNRREQTLACLRALHECARKLQNTELLTILVDDGSSDGTSSAVAEALPQTHILNGDGSLYWCGAMRLAMSTARAMDPDYYWWINDDVSLYSDALERLLATQIWGVSTLKQDAIVVGSTADPKTQRTTYGGRVRSKAFHPLWLSLVEPGLTPNRCETMNGNCVLIPRAVVEQIGNLDERFVHGLGDWDYGLRASAAGIAIFVCPGHVGTCSIGGDRGDNASSFATMRSAWRKISGPKAFPPSAWRTYTKRYGGPFWVANWLRPYVVAIVRGLFNGGI